MEGISAPIVVIGGGPAGALAAAELARAGRGVLLIDEKLAWEKPCGGGVTEKALRQYPFLADAVPARNWVSECELTSPRGRALRLALDRPMAIFSRRVLNQLLLDRARAAGAEIVCDRVVACAPAAAGSWELRLRSGPALRAAVVINTSGARNPLVHLPSPLGPDDWMATAGYYVPAARLPWPATRMVIRFLPGLEGYIWSFPRVDHASVGICGRLGGAEHGAAAAAARAAARGLGGGSRRRGVLCAFVAGAVAAGAHPRRRRGRRRERGLDGCGRRRRAGRPHHRRRPVLRPAFSRTARRRAGGSAHPSGGCSRLQARPAARAGAGAGGGGRAGAPFFQGRFAGDAVLERMILFGQRSARFRHLLCELFSGAQGYTGLRRRLWRNLVPSLAEMTFSA